MINDYVHALLITPIKGYLEVNASITRVEGNDLDVDSPVNMSVSHCRWNICVLGWVWQGVAHQHHLGGRGEWTE